MKTTQFFSFNVTPMKKLSLIALSMIPFIGFCQKKENGKIYIEHPAINIVDAFTKAMVAGDTTAMGKLMTADFRANNPVYARPHDKGADRQLSSEMRKAIMTILIIIPSRQ